MPNNPDIPDTGRIQQDPSRTGRDAKLGYATDETTADAATDRAIHDAMAENVGTRRDHRRDEKLPTDPIEDEIPGPQPKP